MRFCKLLLPGATKTISSLFRLFSTHSSPICFHVKPCRSTAISRIFIATVTVSVLPPMQRASTELFGPFVCDEALPLAISMIHCPYYRFDVNLFRPLLGYLVSHVIREVYDRGYLDVLFGIMNGESGHIFSHLDVTTESFPIQSKRYSTQLPLTGWKERTFPRVIMFPSSSVGMQTSSMEFLVLSLLLEL